MHPSDIVAVAVVAAVGALALALFAIAVGAWRRTGNGKLLWVAAAFAVFAVKGAATALSLLSDSIHHEDLEMLGAGLDLAILVLMVAPLLRR